MNDVKSNHDRPGLSYLSQKFRFIMVLLFAWLPTSVLANASSSPLDFSPPESDASVKLLQTIFGLVDGVLYGTGSQIVGEMFGMFNSAVLVLGAIILIYTTLTSVLNTANEGEYLGQRWNSIWIPIRSVVGVALLLPKASGYCAIQIFVMWVVVQGIGAADLIWNSALNYLQRGGVIVAQNVDISSGTLTNSVSANSSDGTISVVGLADSPSQSSSLGSESLNLYDTDIFKNTGPLLKALVCMHSLQYALEMQRDEFMNPSIGGVDPGIVPTFFTYMHVLESDGSVPARSTIEFPPQIPHIPVYNAYHGVCGSISWDNFTVDEIGNKLSAAGVKGIQSNGTYNANDSRISAAVKARALAVGQMLNELSTTAEAIVNNYKLEESNRLPLGMWSDSTTTATWIGDRSYTQIPLLTGSELRNAAASYYALIMPTMRLLRSSIEDIDFIEGAKSDGWILAGSFFFKLALIEQSMSDFDLSGESITVSDRSTRLLTETPIAIEISGANKDFELTHDMLQKTPLSTLTGDYSRSNYLDKYVEEALKERKRLGIEQPEADSPKDAPFTIPEIQIEVPSSCGTSVFIDLCFPFYIKFVLFKVTNVILKAFVAISNGVVFILLTPIYHLGVHFLQMSQEAFQPGKNPILELAAYGRSLIDFAFDMVVQFLFATLAISLIPVIGSGAALFLVIILGPMVFVAATIMLSYGTIYAFYIPLIPYLVFTFASLAWFIAVIEAMVAAPIVALGLAHPEGHDSFGKANESIMLLSNVFLRPGLMVIGFIIAIILSFVTLHLVNAGFFRAIKAITDPAFGIASYIAPLFIVGLYTTMVMQVVQKSFDIIYLLPDRVLRWIGGHGTPGTTGEQMIGGGGADTGGGALGGAKSAVESTTGTVNEVVDQVAKTIDSSATKKAKKMIAGKGKGKGKGKKDKNKKDKNKKDKNKKKPDSQMPSLSISSDD